MKRLSKINPDSFVINEVFKIIDKHTKKLTEADNVSRDEFDRYSQRGNREDSANAELFDDPRRLTFLLNGVKKLSGPIYVEYVLKN